MADGPESVSHGIGPTGGGAPTEGAPRPEHSGDSERWLAPLVNNVYFENMAKQISTSDRPRDRRRRARIEAILDRSMETLLTQGVDQLTMRGLADSLDLTAGALYRYFPSKGAILTSLGHRASHALAGSDDNSHANV